MTSGYAHGFNVLNRTIAKAQAAFKSTRAKLERYNNTSIFISEQYVTYTSFWTFYHSDSGSEPPVGTPAYGGGNRLFDRASITSNLSALREMVETIAGTPEQQTTNHFELVSGGQVYRDASDPYSGVNPAWRKSYFNNIVARVSPLGTAQSILDQRQGDITHVKVAAMKKLAPNTGAYMNEGDRFDPDWKVDFYGREN